MAPGGALAPGVLYDGADGPLFHDGSLMPTLSAASPSLDSTGVVPSVAAQDPPPPKYYKLEFATYDGSVDPLNWLNQCGRGDARPPDLQTAMYYARAFEHHAAAMQLAPPPQAAPPAPCQGQPPPARAPRVAQAGQAPAAANAAPAACPFCRLTPTEQLECRCQGLCYNCDEPYVPRHVCQRLFYLEFGDYIEEDAAPTEDGDAAIPLEEPAA
ncbi:uncharacterized protein [Miscanthus floridulus]|uniref:uncharacterized protein n=1 Tax=Miscanthus floridulus TaxID=154761 RepID=UPI0034590E1D